LIPKTVLTPVQKKKQKKSGGRFAIVASLYNRRYVDAMLSAARKTLSAAGATEVKVLRVPGAYEIPVVAAALCCGRSGNYDAVICLGVILRGETAHAQHIGEAVTMGLTQIQVDTCVPVIHEVLLLENEAQAKVRCLGTKHNRGTEAAQTALQMAQVIKSLRGTEVPF
jgi:6,7-dimethyl-8-ribityllumazine synthase